MAYQYMPKIFHDSHKNPLAPPPTNFIYGPLFYLSIMGNIFYAYISCFLLNQ